MIGLIKNNWIKSYIVKYLLFEYILFLLNPLYT